MPGPQVCVGGCLRVVARGMAVGARFRGASGTPPPTVFPGKGGDGSLPLIRPCGATFPQGGRLGCCWRQRKPPRGVGDAAPCGLPGEWAAAGGRGGVGAPRPTDGDMETLWGLRGHPFPGRRAVGARAGPPRGGGGPAGKGGGGGGVGGVLAGPGGLRGHPSMVRSVGRGLDPSAGVGGSGSLRGW